MKKRTLQVTLHAREPSTVELTVGERVQFDRLVPVQRGYVAERHGPLLRPGVTTLELDPGFYAFRTLSDANLQVVRGGVAASAGTGGKEIPPPPVTAPDDEQPPTLERRGDELPGELPALTVGGA
jgi:hypothetical protein